MSKELVSDELWEIVEPLLPKGARVVGVVYPERCLLRNRKLPYRLVAANPSQDMAGKNMLISSLVTQCFQASPSKLAHEHRPKLLRRSSNLCPFTHRC